ncbi:MAG: hypothetical protein JWR38_2793 [Mucilaginibacter sp.]|nr:hypothetical protein [Mucilaginibacter sp.]
MKKNRFFIFIVTLASLAVAGCNKVSIKPPNDFKVTTRAVIYTTQDTVTFNLAGNPDYITFYSGELHKNYAFANIKQRTPDSNLVTFSTTTTTPGTSTQATTDNNVTILASTDFSGSIDSPSIKKATWTDISGRARFATGASTVASGNVNITDITQKGKPVYIAFKYVSAGATATYLPRKEVVNSFTFRNFFPDTTYIQVNSFSNGGFYIKSILNNANQWIMTNASLTFNAPAVGSAPDEDWAISRPFDPTIVSPDVGIAIKTKTDPLGLYSYKFTKPGTYVVTFVATNSDSATTRQTVRQITLTITN